MRSRRHDTVDVEGRFPSERIVHPRARTISPNRHRNAAENPKSDEALLANTGEATELRFPQADRVSLTSTP
jgi:hypothetical protein